MTRVNVFHEGVQKFESGKLVGVGALKLPDKHQDGDPLPVVVNFVPSMIIARAGRMERADDGWVSFEIEFITPRFERIYSDWDLTVYANAIKEEFQPKLNHSIVTSATLRALSYYDPTSSDMGRSLPV